MKQGGLWKQASWVLSVLPAVNRARNTLSPVAAAPNWALAAGFKVLQLLQKGTPPHAVMLLFQLELKIIACILHPAC